MQISGKKVFIIFAAVLVSLFSLREGGNAESGKSINEGKARGAGKTGNYMPALAKELTGLQISALHGADEVGPVFDTVSYQLYRKPERILLSRDLQRLSLVRQSFASDDNILTGFSLGVRTFKGGILPGAFRYRLIDAPSRSVLREGFLLSPEKGEKNRVKIQFEPLYSTKEKTYILELLPSFPLRDSPLLLEMSGKDAVTGGSLAINGRKMKGDLLLHIHAGKNLRLAGGDVTSPEAKYIVALKKEKGGKLLLLLLKRETMEVEYVTPLLLKGLPDDRGVAEAARRVKAFLQKKEIPSPAAGDISEGQRHITLSWFPVVGVSRYRVYRSSRPGGPFALAGETSSILFRDRGSEPGRVYWYRVQSVKGEGTSNLSMPLRGYRAPAKPGGKDLYALLDLKNKEAGNAASPAEKRMREDHLNYLDRYHMNAFKLTLALFIARAYLSDGRITVLNKFDHFYTDRQRSTLYGVEENLYAAKLFSHKFFRILEEGRGSSGLLHRISFGQKGNAGRYGVSGWKVKNAAYSINDQGDASIILPVKKTGKVFQWNMLVIPRLNHKKGIYHRIFKVRVNGKNMGTCFADRKAWHSVKFPVSLVRRGRVKIEIIPVRENEADNGKGSLLIGKANLVQNPRGDILAGRLINHSILFTVPAGEKEYMKKSGETVILPYFHAAGIAAEYYKNYSSWRSNTLLISTSDGKLKKEIRKAQDKK